MSKPDDIPQGVWDDAEKAYWHAVAGGSYTDDPWESIARAILSERQECAKLASAIKGAWGPVPEGYIGTAVYTPATGDDIAKAIMIRP